MIGAESRTRPRPRPQQPQKSISSIRQQFRDRVRFTLGESGRVRADRITRTEVGGGLNAGHDMTRRVLAAKTGVQIKKQWLCVRDRWTRETHLAADGQEVNASDDFTVGGERAAYPGDRRLSAAERIRCRCTSITTGIDAVFAD